MAARGGGAFLGPPDPKGNYTGSGGPDGHLVPTPHNICDIYMWHVQIQIGAVFDKAAAPSGEEHTKYNFIAFRFLQNVEPPPKDYIWKQRYVFDEKGGYQRVFAS